jgi:glycosyltransferase involved in cell wall biosynthesis
VRVLLLTDRIFATRERTLLVRLEVGLADEGVRVVHAVPRDAAAIAQELATPGVFTTPVTYEASGLPLTLSLRAAKLLRTAGVDPEDEATRVDVVHVFGGSAWDMGRELARQCGAALALEVWRAGLTTKARAFKAPGGIAGEDPPLLFAPDPVVERLLMREGPGPVVRTVRWGVHAPAIDEQRAVPDRPPFVAMVGGGRDRRAAGAALEGLSRVLGAFPNLVAIADAAAARSAGLWALARKLGILHNLSLNEELEGRREMVLNADVFLHAESGGEQRSMLLDAMAHGKVVIAAEDKSVSWLVDGRTARIVPRGDAGAWAAAIEAMLKDKAAARALGESARLYVREHHRVSDHVAGILAAYHWLVSEDSIPIQAGRASGPGLG